MAFLAYQPKSEETVEREGQGFDQEIFEEDWRPAQVVIADLTGETVRTRVLPLDGSASELHWSPDGEHLVLALAPTSLIDDHYMYRRIKIVDVESGDIVTAIDNPGKLGEIAWSPDGQHIAFISGVDIHDPREGRLMLADISTGDSRIFCRITKVMSVQWRGKMITPFSISVMRMAGLRTIKYE